VPPGQAQPLKPKNLKLSDFQMIIINPSGHRDVAQLLTVKYLQEKSIAPDSSFAALFAHHSRNFIVKPLVLDKSLLLPSSLPRKGLG
jgi:hypothetical protein